MVIILRFKKKFHCNEEKGVTETVDIMRDSIKYNNVPTHSSVCITKVYVYSRMYIYIYTYRIYIYSCIIIYGYVYVRTKTIKNDFTLV